MTINQDILKAMNESLDKSEGESEDPSGQGDQTSVVEEVVSGIMTRKLNVRYGEQRAVRMMSMLIPEKKVTAFIGPSGCGKSTLLRCFNRMNDLITGCTIDGSIVIDGKNIYGDDVNVHILRRKIGMVFQKSNPFPKSIFENVAFGLRLKGDKKKAELEATVEQSLRDVGLWEEVSDRLHESALLLSGGQQQRLCIARALATEPQILLMDEPCSALDPIATSRIEELIGELSKRITILIVTHNMQQAARISDWTAFLMQGELVEFDKTDVLFQQPGDPRTDDYIRGRFG